MLLAECAAAGVEIRTGHRVTALGRPGGFTVDTDRGSFAAEALVLATGGLSIPKIGATGFAFDAARRFGLPVTATRPALVPLVASNDDLPLMRPLSGVALPVEARCGRRRVQRGHAVHPSRAVRPGDPAGVVGLAGRRGGERSTCCPAPTPWPCCGPPRPERPRAALRTVLAGLLPQRLADALARAGPGGPVANLPDRTLADVAAALSAWPVSPAGTEGYAKAEVTLGGVDTAALSSRTMAARDVPGLFVVGEAVDVTGWLGGYNFQWAWSSGWCAGMAA